MSDEPENRDAPGDDRTRFEDSVEQEMLLWALENLALSHGTVFAPTNVRVAVLEAQRDIPGPASAVWSHRLRAAAHSVGLALNEVASPAAELMTAVTPAAHLVLWAGGDGQPRLVAVTERAGRKVRVVSSLPNEEERWVDYDELCQIVGAQPEGDAIRAVFAEPAAPLEALRRNDDEPNEAAATPLSRLRALLASERTDLLVVLAYAVAVGVMSLAMPVAVQSLVNTVAFGSLLQPLVVLAFVLLACLAIVGVMRALQFYVVEMIQRRVFVRATADLAFRLPRVRLDAYEGHYGPELVNRFFDVLTVQKSASQLLLDGLAVILQAVTGLLLLAFYHPALLAFDAVLIAALAFIIFVLGRGGIPTAIKESKAKYAVAAWLQELARHPTSFKAAGGPALAMGRANALAKEYLLARRKHFGVVMRQMLGGLGTQAVASTLLLGIGGFLVIERQLTLGQLVASELIVAAVVAGFSKLGKTLDSFYKLVAAVDKLGVLVDLPLERDSGETLPAASGPAAVAFRNVSYAYVGGRPALSNVYLDVSPGERVALIGSSGAGKGTLLELAFGLRRASTGAVLLDGIDVRDLRVESVRRDVLYLNSIEIIDGSLADNVTLGRTDITPTQIRDALTKVALLDDVLALPEGLQTPLLATGAPLSSGQARRLMIARALVTKPRLLLIRETLDQLAPDVRDRTLSAVFGPGTRWTVLVVTHDHGVVAACDRALEIRGGKIVGRSQGPVKRAPSPVPEIGGTA